MIERVSGWVVNGHKADSSLGAEAVVAHRASSQPVSEAFRPEAVMRRMGLSNAGRGSILALPFVDEATPRWIDEAMLAPWRLGYWPFRSPRAQTPDAGDACYGPSLTDLLARPGSTPAAFSRGRCTERTEEEQHETNFRACHNGSGYQHRLNE